MTPPLPLIRRRRISQRGDQLTHGSPLRYQTFLFFIVSWPVATFLMDCHANFNCRHDSAFVGCVGESRGPGKSPLKCDNMSICRNIVETLIGE